MNKDTLRPFAPWAPILLGTAIAFGWLAGCQFVSDNGDDQIATRAELNRCTAKSKESLSICGLAAVDALPRCNYDNCYQALSLSVDGDAPYFCSVFEKKLRWLKVDTSATCAGPDVTIIPIEIEQAQKDKPVVNDPPPADEAPPQDPSPEQPPADDPPADSDDQDDDSDDDDDSSDDDTTEFKTPIDKLLEQIFGGRIPFGF